METDVVTFSKFKVTSALTDMESRIRPGAFVGLLIESAIQSSDKLGFGFDNLKIHNLFWVFSRLSVNIFKPIKWNDVVEIETWPKDINGIFYIRDFIVRNNKSEVLAKASSAWLPIDFKTKRPKRRESFDTDIFVSLKDKYALESPPEKLSEITEGERFTVNSTYFDLDFNKHVTSTRYIDWMMDTFSVEFHNKNYFKMLTVNFIKETLSGVKLKILKNNYEKGKYLFEGTNIDSGKCSFRGKITF